MAQRNEDAIRRRIEQRIAYVQANPNISKAQAREQFYVQTRAAELEAQGLEVDRKALRQKFRSGQVSREGFYVQGEQERLQAAARTRVSNEVGSNTQNIGIAGQQGRAVDNVRIVGGQSTGDSFSRVYGIREGGQRQPATPQEIARYESQSAAIARRQNMESYYDAYGNKRYREKGVKGKIAQISNQLGSYLDVQVAGPVADIAIGTGKSVGRVTSSDAVRYTPLGLVSPKNINVVANKFFGKTPFSEEYTSTPTPLDIVTVASFAAGAGAKSKVTSTTAKTGGLFGRTRFGRIVSGAVRDTRLAVEEKVAGAQALANAEKFAAKYGELYPKGGVVAPPKGTNWAAGVKPSKPSGNWAAGVKPTRGSTNRAGAAAVSTPAPAAPAPASSAAATASRQELLDAFIGQRVPEPTATPGGAAAQAIDDLAKRVDELNAPAQPTTKPAGGKGSRGGKTKKAETTPAPSATGSQKAEAEAALEAGKQRLKDLKKERTEAKKWSVEDPDGAAGVIEDLNRQIKETEAQLSRLKTNMGRPAGGGTAAPAPAAPSRTVTSGAKPAPAPAPTPAPSASGQIPWLDNPPAAPTRGASTRSARSGGGRRTDTNRGQTQPAAAETVPPARQTRSRGNKQAESVSEPTVPASEEEVLDIMWRWSKENKAAAEAGTLGPRPAGWKPPSQRGADAVIPKNEPVKIEIEPTRARELARKEAESIAVARESNATLRQAERRRAEAGNVRTQQRGVRTSYRNKEERLRALQDELAAKGGADPIIQKRIDNLQKQISQERNKRRTMLSVQRSMQGEARGLERRGRALQEQRLDYVGRPESGPRMDQTQGRTRTAQDAFDSARGSLDDLINPMDLD